MALTRVTSSVIDTTANSTAGQVLTAGTYGSLVWVNQANLAVAGANVTGTVASATLASTADIANSVAGANVTGTVANSTYATIAGTSNSVAGANVTGTVASASTATTVTTNAQSNITSVGTLVSLTTTGDVLVGGNLTVNGVMTTVHSTEIALDDKNLTLANSATTAAQANGGGITLNGADATMLYKSSDDTWNFNKQIVGNLTGTAGVANSVAVANVSGIGNIATINLTGNGSQTLLGNGSWGILSSNLTSLSDVSIANVETNQFLKFNGAAWVNSSIVDGGTA